MRAATRCSSADSESHGGTHEGRSDNSVPGGNSPDSTWRCEHLFAPAIPALVEGAAVPLDVLDGRLVRRVARAGREPQEERLGRRCRAQVLQEQLRLVREVFGEVVPLLGRAWWQDRMVVVDEVGSVLVGLAAHEPVVALEPPAEWPSVLRTPRRHLGRRREVPLAHRVRGVAVAHAGSRTGSRSPSGSSSCIPGTPPPTRRRAPCRSSGGCARSAGRLGWASTGPWCGSSRSGGRPRRDGRTSGWRCRSRSSRAGRSRRRPTARGRRWVPLRERRRAAATMVSSRRTSGRSCPRTVGSPNPPGRAPTA